MKRKLGIVMALILCVVVLVSSVGVFAEDYDDTSEIMGWKRFATVPVDVSQYAVATGDKIYVMPIYQGNNLTTRLDIFDTKTKRWSSGKNMIEAVYNTPAIAAVDNKIYVMGGISRNTSIGSNLVQIYNTQTDTWTRGTPMPTGVNEAATTVVGSDIYVCSGYSSNGRTMQLSKEVYIYNTKTDTWRSGAPTPVTLHGSKASSVGGNVYVMGGYANNAGFSPSAYVYNIETNKWSEVARMPNNGNLRGAVSVGENIYVLGDEESRCIDVYNTRTKAWSVSTDAWPKGVELPENHVYQAVTIDGTIYAMNRKYIFAVETAQGVKTNELSISLEVGQSIQLNGTGGLADTDLTWTSSNSSVVSVDNSGKVIALKKGVAYISAKSIDGTTEQSIAIKVTETEPVEKNPVVTNVKWTETGAVVTATGDKKVVMYGVSATKDPAAATWKSNNSFANVKVGATYYFFAKDEEGNISEPFAFNRTE